MIICQLILQMEYDVFTPIQCLNTLGMLDKFWHVDFFFQNFLLERKTLSSKIAEMENISIMQMMGGDIKS